MIMNVYECNGKKFHEMEYGIYHFTAMERFPLHAQQNGNFYSISVIIISQLNEQNLVRCDIFNKYKTFSVLIYNYINTSGNWGEIVWKHDARRAECFHTISRFPNFHEC